MLEVREKPRLVERALLVGFVTPEGDPENTLALLDELEGLVSTLGIGVVEKISLPLRKPQPKFLIGSGKAAEVIERAEAAQCDVIVFDDEIAPGQQRNWERLAKDRLLVIDRQEIILDIFSERAQTKEATLQVELARAEYNLPRLRRAWTHLGRQRGGGTTQRGEGETQLEADRRMIRDRITKLRRELSQVARRRETQRKSRTEIPIPTGAIVGYTNAGKSSLLNALTEADVAAEDKLFATLDPTTRRLKLPNGQIIVVTDTVGFVRKLPHRLVDAFKATLEEAVVADFLIHVIDASNPDFEEHRKTTEAVLEELGALNKPTVFVFNKIDLLAPAALSTLRNRFPDAIFVSAGNREGMDALRLELCTSVEKNVCSMEMMIPHDRYDVVHFLHEIGAVQHEEHTDRGVLIQGNVPARQINRVAPFATAGSIGINGHSRTLSGVRGAPV